MSAVFTLVHISDLHFHRLPTRVGQWFSKRGLGALNLLFQRARLYPPSRAQQLVATLEEMDWQHLVITGDITQLALEAEFALAREVLSPLLARGAARVTVLPGNHDRYVAESRDYFQEYFGEFFGPAPLVCRELNARWHLAAWDSTMPTGPFMAHGRVRPESLRATETWLAGLPPHSRVILANHYPLHYPPPHRYQPHHDLENWREVQDWLNRQAISLYLHGHVHHNWVLNRTHPLGRQTHVNSASSTRLPRPGERSAYHRILLAGDDWEVQPQQLDQPPSGSGLRD